MLTRSEAETVRAGRDLAATLSAGDVIILTGPLGSGKTAFVRGLAEGLGLDPRQVHSPSFAIIDEHGPGRSGLRLVHVDLYRLESEAEIEDLGLADYLTGERVMAVEWGEKLPKRFREGAVHVRLEHAGDELRELTISRAGSSGPPS